MQYSLFGGDPQLNHVFMKISKELQKESNTYCELGGGGVVVGVDPRMRAPTISV